MRVVKVPHETIDARVIGQRIRWIEPEFGNVWRSNRFLDRVARIVAHQISLLVVNIECEFALRRRFLKILQHGAVRGIAARGRFRLQRRIRIVVPADADCGLRREKLRGRLGKFRGPLAERGDVVKDPESAAKRGGDEIRAVNCQVGNIGGGQIQLQRLPVIAGIERNIDRVGSAGEQESLAAGIFANRARHARLGQASDDFLPRLSRVARAIKIRMHVAWRVERGKRAVRSKDRRVGGIGIMRRCFDAIDVRMFGKIRGRYIVPGGTVASQVD